MRADVALAQCRYQVREAARGWQRAGAIDEATQIAIDAAYPDDRARLGPVFRVLVFGFTVTAVSAVLGLFGLVIASWGEGAGKLLLVLFGIALLLATDIQIGALRRTQGGTESASAFLGLCYLLSGLLWIVFEGLKPGEGVSINLALILVVALFGGAGYRWGYVLFTAAAAGALFLLVGRGPFGRVLWVIVPLMLAPAVLRAGDASRLAPAHRRGCQAVAAVALVFLYLAVHVGSWDVGLVEMVTGDLHGGRPSAPLRPLFVLATAVVPLVTMSWGIGTRRRLLIDLGLVGVLASLVTLRFYVHLAPLWCVLLLGGGVAIGVALALRRYLDSGAGRERSGYTAEPLFSDPERRSALEVAASVASLSPAARTVEAPGFQGGGGRSGGGGATDSF